MCVCVCACVCARQEENKGAYRDINTRSTIFHFAKSYQISTLLTFCILYCILAYCACKINVRTLVPSPVCGDVSVFIITSQNR